MLQYGRKDIATSLLPQLSTLMLFIRAYTIQTFSISTFTYRPHSLSL